MEAKVVIGKCGRARNLFGMRIQKMDNGDWYRTWAFKINESAAKREGYDKENITGSLTSTPEYPGCPYCGGMGFWQCGACRKMVCWNGVDSFVTCPWCGTSGQIQVSNSFNVNTDSF